MITTPVNSIYISGLTIVEMQSYFEKFGSEGFFGGHGGGRVLISIKDKNQYVINKLETFFNIDLTNITFVVLDFSDTRK